MRLVVGAVVVLVALCALCFVSLLLMADWGFFVTAFLELGCGAVGNAIKFCDD